MMEFIHECTNLVNLPFTILAVLVCLYWIFVILGVVGFDAFDIDLDTDWDADFDTDLDMDGSYDADAGGETSFSVGVLKFFHLGEAPLMLILSVFIIAMWASSVLANHYLNNETSWMMAALLFGPNVIISLIISKLILLPIVPIFRLMSSGEATRMKIVGKTCLITTEEVSEKFGQAEIAQDGPPIVINVRVKKGDFVTKGDVAIVYSYDESDNTYQVKPVYAEEN